MISKAKIKEIRSLDLKKFRDELGVFIAQGDKVVSELLPIFHCRTLLATKDWLLANKSIKATEIIEVTEQELSSTSLQKSPQQVLAIFNKKESCYTISEVTTQLVLVLDDIQDPGNLGTIVRIADWFGIRHIFCSLHCADIYNPKTIQATMGALARVQIHYVCLSDFLRQLPTSFPIYGTLLNGENMYEKTLDNKGVIVMGNEGKGISEEIQKYISQALFIPNYPMGAPTSESLNVAVATAIVCAEFRRVAL